MARLHVRCKEYAEPVSWKCVDFVGHFEIVEPGAARKFGYGQTLFAATVVSKSPIQWNGWF